MSEVDQLKLDEGWRAKAYKDHLGTWTIGYGFTNLTKAEGDMVLEMRVESIHARLRALFHWYIGLPEDAQNVLVNMAYQLGVHGLMKFSKMLQHVEKREWFLASGQGLDSRWAKQTPGRAKRLMARLVQLDCTC